jgi:hypothetical protein
MIRVVFFCVEVEGVEVSLLKHFPKYHLAKFCPFLKGLVVPTTSLHEDSVDSMPARH